METRRTAAQMLAAMMSELSNKYCWTLAKHAGGRSPDALQHLLSSAVFDEDGRREDLRDCAVSGLGGARAILVVEVLDLQP